MYLQHLKPAVASVVQQTLTVAIGELRKLVAVTVAGVAERLEILEVAAEIETAAAAAALVVVAAVVAVAVAVAVGGSPTAP